MVTSKRSATDCELWGLLRIRGSHEQKRKEQGRKARKRRRAGGFVAARQIYIYTHIYILSLVSHKK